MENQQQIQQESYSVKRNKPNLWGYVGRFILIHIVTYTVIAAIFLIFQNALPEAKRIALELFEPYRSFSLMTIIGQLMRGLAIALVLYPFYNAIFRNRWGKFVLFGAMWGLGLFGSVEPQPGSIEGIIYTETSFLEHASVMVAVAIQVLLFVWLFFKWENFLRKEKGLKEKVIFKPELKKLRGYSIRFTLVHLLTYWIAGMLFYQFAGYEEALDTMEIFELWRPLESITFFLLLFFGQILRGVILALLLYPFYHTYMRKRHGWLFLFLLIFGLTALGSPILIPEFLIIEETFSEFIQILIIGIPEIFSQMLVFSLIFFFWERKISTSVGKRNSECRVG